MTARSPAERQRARSEEQVDPLLFLEMFEGRTPSRLDHHGASCCSRAEAWFRALARSAARQEGSEPRWIPARWPWGPMRWPLAWCQAVRMRRLDCGALAELAEVALAESGAQALRVQRLEEISPEQAEQWRVRWGEVPEAPRWVWGTFAYHEEVAILDGGSIRIWDPGRASWRRRRDQTLGLAFSAMRLFAHQGAAPVPLNQVRWDDCDVTLGAWVHFTGSHSRTHSP